MITTRCFINIDITIWTMFICLWKIISEIYFILGFLKLFFHNVPQLSHSKFLQTMFSSDKLPAKFQLFFGHFIHD